MGPISNKVEIIEADINDLERLKPAADKVEIVFHLAAISRTSESHKDREGCFRTNVGGTFSLLEACKDARPRIIFPSSWVVYDKNSIVDGDATVESAKLRTSSPYAISKQVGEEYVRFYSDQYGIDYSIFRFSNVYGAGDKNRIMPMIVDKALRNEPITVFGEHHYINFVNVKDVVNAIYLASQEAKAKNNTMNIGCQESINLADLAQQIVARCKSTSAIKVAPLDSSEYPYYRPDLNLARQLIGYVPSVSLDEGVAEVVESRKSMIKEDGYTTA